MSDKPRWTERPLPLLPSSLRLRIKRWAELRYWRTRESIDSNAHYEYFFTEHFGLDRDFYKGKRVLDVGCGPRGSLEWMDVASEVVGADPLADEYRKIGAPKGRMQ